MQRTTVLLLAKYPRPGSVKTRMVPPMSPTEAAALHVASLRCVVERVARVPSLDLQVVVTPDDRVDDFGRLVGYGVSRIRPQGDGHLGRRLRRAAEKAFSGGAKGVVLLGADSPTLPVELLTEAASALVRREAVLGPCEDGGYYLLGLRRPLPMLFERIDWGGPSVAAQTRERAAAANVALLELPVWYDLDTFDDLSRAAEDLAGTPETPHLAADALRQLLDTYLERYSDGRTH